MNSDDCKAFLSAGVDAVLFKPLKLPLLDQILRYIEQHSSLSLVDHGMRLMFTEENVSVILVENIL